MNKMAKSLAVFGAVMLVLPQAGQAERVKMNVNVGVINDGRGVCGVSFPFDGNKKLEITMRSSDGNVAMAINNMPADVVKAGLDKENVPITLQFDDSLTTTADVGNFRAGFYYKAQAYWTDKSKGAAAVAALKDAENITVKLDGKTYGPISTQLKGFAYNMMRDCVEKNGASMP